MDRNANSKIGSIESNYVGKAIQCITVDGQDPNGLTYPQFKLPKP
jgi:hypothetical protein